MNTTLPATKNWFEWNQWNSKWKPNWMAFHVTRKIRYITDIVPKWMRCCIIDQICISFGKYIMHSLNMLDIICFLTYVFFFGVAFTFDVFISIYRYMSNVFIYTTALLNTSLHVVRYFTITGQRDVIYYIHTLLSHISHDTWRNKGSMAYPKRWTWQRRRLSENWAEAAARWWGRRGLCWSCSTKNQKGHLRCHC